MGCNATNADGISPSHAIKNSEAVTIPVLTKNFNRSVEYFKQMFRKKMKTSCSVGRKK